MDFLSREGWFALFLTYVACFVGFVCFECIRRRLIKRGRYDPELGWLIFFGKRVRKNYCTYSYRCTDCGAELQTSDGCYKCDSINVVASVSTKA